MSTITALLVVGFLCLMYKLGLPAKFWLGIASWNTVSLVTSLFLWPSNVMWGYIEPENYLMPIVVPLAIWVAYTYDEMTCWLGVHGWSLRRR